MEKQREYERSRGSAADRGYDAFWRRRRLVVLARDPVCKHSGCNQRSTQVDHVVPRRRGGTDDLENLQALCSTHHSMKTAELDGGWGNESKG